MKPPTKFSRIIEGKRYNVETATLIAGNDYWDGHNFERSGTNTFLYRTAKGRYFQVRLTQWQGEQDFLTRISQEYALNLFESWPGGQRVSYQEAFPGVEIEEA